MHLSKNDMLKIFILFFVQQFVNQHGFFGIYICSHFLKKYWNNKNGINVVLYLFLIIKNILK